MRHGTYPGITQPDGSERPYAGDDRPVGPWALVTVVESPGCHLCEGARTDLAVLAQTYPLNVDVVSLTSERGRALMQQHRAPMSPLVLLDGAYFSSGRLPRRKLERRLARAGGGGSDG